MRDRLDALPAGALRRAAWALVAVGALVRLAVAVVFEAGFDLTNILAAGAALGDHGLHVYAAANTAGADAPGYPYPPAFLPWVWLASAGPATDLVGRLPQIAADAGIALVVFRVLRGRGASGSAALAAVALVALNPIAIYISANVGQIDGLAILPALLGLILWDRGGDRRALYGGLLLGLAVAIKTPPVLLLFALIPTVRSLREMLVATAAAGGVAAVLLAPFLLAEADAVIRAVTYHGVGGQGGLSALLQPNLVKFTHEPLTGVVAALDPINSVLVLLALAATALYLRRHRLAALESAAIVFLVAYVVSLHWLAQYAIWALPFLLVAGHLRYAALLSVFYAVYAWPLLSPLLTRLSLPEDAPATVWIANAAVLWLLWAGGLVRLLRPLRDRERGAQDRRVAVRADDHVVAGLLGRQ